MTKHKTKDNPRQAFMTLAVWIIAIGLGVAFWIALDYAICQTLGALCNQ